MTKQVPDRDTIVAVATPPGRGPISIVRVSGAKAIPIAASLFRGARNPRDMPGFTMAHGWIEADGERLDEVLCLVMRGPKSYTREDVVEFHCHGGPIPTRRVLDEIIKAGAVPARPGEFTKRAFLAGRIDLARAEAVCDLIAGETQAAARAAAAQLEGGLSDNIRDLRQKLTELLAGLEAGIDFCDEEDVVSVSPKELVRLLEEAQAQIERLLKNAEQGRRFREGARVVIAGRPNVGKSTLMNTLLRSERVIVTDLPGTTRDVVEDMVEVSGIPIRLFDTAGLGEAVDQVERIGVSRAKTAMESADLVLVLVDGSETIIEDDRKIVSAIDGPFVLVINKCDLGVAVKDEEVSMLAGGAPVARISALAREGIDGLERTITECLIGDAALGETPLVTNVRHAEALQRAKDAIKRGRQAHAEGLSHEFIAGDLRLAIESVSEITGEAVADEVLDIIFGRFCIGK